MRTHTLTALATVLMLGSAGLASAQTTTPTSPSAPSTMGNSSTSVTTPSAAFTESLKGKDVVNLEGDAIGEVEGIQGDNLVVSVGGFLGIGARNVALSRSQVSITGTGDDQKIVTSLTKDELKAMPEVTMDKNAPRTAPATRDGTTVPGGTTRPMQ
jgi:hypothetical protein